MAFEDGIRELQFSDLVYHQLGTVLATVAMPEDTLSAHFQRQEWREMLARLVDEALPILELADIKQRRVAGISSVAQPHYGRLLRAHPCVFRILQGQLHGELVECRAVACGPVAVRPKGPAACELQAQHIVGPLVRLGEEHDRATPRLSLLLNISSRMEGLTPDSFSSSTKNALAELRAVSNARVGQARAGTQQAQPTQVPVAQPKLQLGNTEGGSLVAKRLFGSDPAEAPAKTERKESAPDIADALNRYHKQTGIDNPTSASVSGQVANGSTATFGVEDKLGQYERAKAKYRK